MAIKSPSIAGAKGVRPKVEILRALLMIEKGKARRQESESPEEKVEAQGVLETSVL